MKRKAAGSPPGPSRALALPQAPRWDHCLIYEMIPPRSSVLDLGCGDGELLSRLIGEKRVTGLGIEKDVNCLIRSVARGVPVLHADLDEGLTGFPDAFFDFVILEQTLHVLHKPLRVLEEMLRVGRAGIVSFPNFGHWKVATGLALTGRLPVAAAHPHRWDEINVHPFTVYDFLDWTENRGVRVKCAFGLVNGSVRAFRRRHARWAEEVLFVVSGYPGFPG